MAAPRGCDIEHGSQEAGGLARCSVVSRLVAWPRDLTVAPARCCLFAFYHPFHLPSWHHDAQTLADLQTVIEKIQGERAELEQTAANLTSHLAAFPSSFFTPFFESPALSLARRETAASLSRLSENLREGIRIARSGAAVLETRLAQMNEALEGQQMNASPSLGGAAPQVRDSLLRLKAMLEGVMPLCEEMCEHRVTPCVHPLQPC